MIIDTTYLLPLAKIEIDTDLLSAIATGRVKISLGDIGVSLISIFELQAKFTKLMLPPVHLIRAVEAIFTTFRIIPFYRADIIETGYRLRKIIPDYIDCILIATAAVSSEDLITEDSLILNNREIIRKEYKIRVLNFNEIIEKL